MVACTRANICAETSSGLLTTFETVPIDTPAASATSRMPAALAMEPPRVGRFLRFWRIVLETPIRPAIDPTGPVAD
ncbi:hypothetical protein GCM10022275_25180 [Tessaracoccus defluvii]